MIRGEWLSLIFDTGPSGRWTVGEARTVGEAHLKAVKRGEILLGTSVLATGGFLLWHHV